MTVFMQRYRFLTHQCKTMIQALMVLGIVLGMFPRETQGQKPPRTSRQSPGSQSVRTGTLSNGLRYYVHANPFPQQRAEFWLAVKAGSLHEDPDQLGFAHFVEHMAFNGTKHFPKLSLIDFVERSGMQFGGDLNAYTSFEETVYQLTLPTDDPKIVTNGLQILQDWAAGDITIDSNEVVAERGVVLGEWRSRMMDTLGMRYQRHMFNTMFGKNNRFIERMPIGKPHLLKTAEPGPLRRFYHDWYRPDLIAVIIVGDIDPNMVEREVQRRFGTIPKPVNPRSSPDLRIARRTGPVIDVFRGFVDLSAMMTWPAKPVSNEPRGMIQQQLVEQLLFGYLQERFLTLQRQQNRPFGVAIIGRQNMSSQVGDMYQLGVGAVPDSMLSGFASALTEIEQVAQHGIPQEWLDRQKAAILRRLESAATTMTTVPSKAFAGSYLGYYLTGQGAIVSQQEELALHRELLPAITSRTISELAATWHRPEKTVIYSFHSFVYETVPPTEPQILAVIDSVARTPQPVFNTKQSESVFAFERQITPGRVTKEQKFGSSGVIEWTLSNGARVLYKQTNFNPDGFLIKAHSFGGTSLLPDSLALSPGRMVDALMTHAAGLGNANRDQLMRQLNTTILTDFQVELTYTDESMLFGGSPKDAERIFQLLYLQFTAPKLDSSAVETWKRNPAAGMSPNDQAAQMLARGNPRLTGPSLAGTQFIDLSQALRIYHDRFGDASDFTFMLVGAIPHVQAKAYAERYLATLPSTNRTVREEPLDPGTRPLVEILRSSQRSVPLPQAMTTVLYDRPLPNNADSLLMQQSEIGALSYILRRRLRLELREKLGETYGAQIAHNFYASPNSHAQIFVNFIMAPNRVDTLVGVMFSEIDSVRQYGVTQEELELAAAVRMRTQQMRLKNNGYWLGAIQLYDQIGVSFDRILKPHEAKLTPQRVQEVAKKYLPASAFVHVTLLPADSTVTDSTIMAWQEKNDLTPKIKAVDTTGPESVRGRSPGRMPGDVTRLTDSGHRRKIE